ncbi:hypothetical protein [Bradyrhizobium sp. SZCCHNS2002]|uniref:hypothetical protein n=1 Tax=Bradyrhizobium sp. SZCCHNS2002 TaxID=3057302 RepID=UPI002916D441|nr:hypothetical protein [Bradyrhizobium sp. SZCCHNS2002]
MWEKPNPLLIAGSPRPLRVAYLIDVANCSDILLDCIFAEAYGRWGGRRTLIIPTKPDAIDPRYTKWLEYHDPDIICSFVLLQDSLVAHIHERYCPTHLIYHDPTGLTESDGLHSRLELPIQGLCSLSIVPALLTRSIGFGGRISNLRIIDKFYDGSESPFIQENFGFLSKSYQPIVPRFHTDLFGTLTLISKDALQNTFLGKTPRSDYLTDERCILEELGKPSEILPLSIASDLFAPYLATDYSEWSEGFNLFVGDSLDDRILFWNQHHRQEEQWIGAISALRVPTSRLTDPEFIGLIKTIIRQRGKRTSRGAPDVTIRSCSLSQADLDRVAQSMRSSDFLSAISCVHHDSHAACIPPFNYEPQYRYRISHTEVRSHEVLEFRENHAYVPPTLPWHMREAPPPEGLRAGNWMVNLRIDRLHDHCRFANVRHEWDLPRRLRLEKAFKVNWQDGGPGRYEQEVTRVIRSGQLSLPRSQDQRSVSITIPEDVDAFLTALCVREEWLPFHRNRRDQPTKRDRYAYAELSDKGRYLIAILEHFDQIPEAFDAFMNGFWRDILIGLGAVPVEKNPELRSEFLTTLRKRLSRRQGALEFRTDDEFDRLAREAIRFGRIVGKMDRLVDHTTLHGDWVKLVEKELQEKGPVSEEDKAHYLDPKRLDRSIQHLCRQKVLFQGREWQCRQCYNRNWVSIDDMQGVLECQVCKQKQSAPVSGDWQFRPNGFILEAYREHGIEAAIWTLWQLSERARSSFYFAPSIKLWESYPENQDGPTVEVDALAVVDGDVYLCEAKSSPGLDKFQREQLVAAAQRIRPNVLLIACMEPSTSNLKGVVADLKSQLGPDIHVELIEFNRDALGDATMLPA